MAVPRWVWGVAGALLFGTGSGSVARGAADPPALEGPVAPAETVPVAPGTEPVAPVVSGESMLHEAFQRPGSPSARVRAPKAPPAPVAERPGEDPPSPQSIWVGGYWDWDAGRDDFAWVPGAYRVPPKGMIWVNGRWERDADGWSRVAGFWSPRQGTPAAPAPAQPRPAAAGPDWRTSGPPADHPADTPGPAPNADAFFVPGHYAPEGERVTWTPGFWARAQPGWDWVPARWVRRPDGWDYRDGSWVRDPGPQAPRRYSVARPPAGGLDLPPAIVDSQPAPNTEADQDLGPRPTTPHDPIAEGEAAARVAEGFPPAAVIVPGGPRYIVPGPMVGPPRGYMFRQPPRIYDPYGVVPPFARRFLDRVIP